MVGIAGSGGGDGGGYNYVQDAEPSDAKEGEEWYDTGANEAYVYDGTNWHKQTVADHSELSGVTASDHHTRPSAGGGLNGGSSFDIVQARHLTGGTRHSIGSDTGPVSYSSDSGVVWFITKTWGNDGGNTSSSTAKVTVEFTDGSTRTWDYSNNSAGYQESTLPHRNSPPARKVTLETGTYADGAGAAFIALEDH